MTRRTGGRPTRTAPRWRRHGATAVLALSLLLLVASILLTRSGLRLVTVESDSMAPAMPEGAVLLERHVPLGELRPGDVITYYAPTPRAPVLTHRVVALERPDGRTVVRTRGDANPGADPWQAELLGDRVWVVTATLPWGGAVVEAVRSPWGLALVSVALPGAFLVSTLRLIWRRPAAARTPAPAPAPGRAVRGVGTGLVVVASAALVLGTPQPAAAAFTAAASGGHRVSTGTLSTPASVTLVDACPVTGSAVDVSWTAVAGTDHTGYRIERRTAAALAWETLATVAATASTYRDPTVVPLVEYTYRVSSVRGPWSSTPRASAPLTLTGTCR